MPWEILELRNALIGCSHVGTMAEPQHGVEDRLGGGCNRRGFGSRCHHRLVPRLSWGQQCGYAATDRICRPRATKRHESIHVRGHPHGNILDVTSGINILDTVLFRRG